MKYLNWLSRDLKYSVVQTDPLIRKLADRWRSIAGKNLGICFPHGKPFCSRRWATASRGFRTGARPGRHFLFSGHFRATMTQYASVSKKNGKNKKKGDDKKRVIQFVYQFETLSACRHLQRMTEGMGSSLGTTASFHRTAPLATCFAAANFEEQHIFNFYANFKETLSQ